MPLLYGEGEERAFLRLQEEILKVSEDYTIFAWASELNDPGRGSGLLASSVNEFNGFHITQGLARSGLLTMKHYDLVNSDEKNYPEHTPTLTSRGLRITLLTRGTAEDDVLHAQFYCLVRVSRREFITKSLVLHLRRSETGGNLYERAAVGPYGLSTLETHEHDHDAFKPLTIYVRQHRELLAPGPQFSQWINEVHRVHLNVTCEHIDLIASEPAGAAETTNMEFVVTSRKDDISCSIIVLVQSKTLCAMVCAGFRYGQPWCYIVRVLENPGPASSPRLLQARLARWKATFSPKAMVDSGDCPGDRANMPLCDELDVKATIKRHGNLLTANSWQGYSLRIVGTPRPA